VWCAECTKEWEEWEELWFQKCNKTEPKQYLTYEAMPNGVVGRIKPLTNQSLCWERMRVNAHQLKPCDDIMVWSMCRKSFEALISTTNLNYIPLIEESIQPIPADQCVFCVIIIPKLTKSFMPKFAKM
jgi:hypothetical protein